MLIIIIKNTRSKTKRPSLGRLVTSAYIFWLWNVKILVNKNSVVTSSPTEFGGKPFDVGSPTLADQH